jgi:hypothetical protein
VRLARTQRARDLAIAIAVALLIAVEVAFTAQREGPLALNLLVLAPAGLALAVRRTRPYVTLAVVAVAYVVSTAWLTDIQELSSTLLPALLAGYSIGR